MLVDDGRGIGWKPYIQYARQERTKGLKSCQKPLVFHINTFRDLHTFILTCLRKGSSIGTEAFETDALFAPAAGFGGGMLLPMFCEIFG